MKSSIALGALVCGLLFLLPAQAAKRAHQFAGAKKCKSCHAKEAIGDQWGKWLDSDHAKAFETLASNKAKDWAKEQNLGDPQREDKCVACHVAAHGEPRERLGSKYKPEEGVTCEACHGAGSAYRKKKVMIDADKAKANGLVEQTAEVCARCHNDESPAWDPARYKLADGQTTGFDYEQAKQRIAHPVPEGYDPSKDTEDED